MVEQLERRLVLAVSSALLDSWFVSGQGEFAQAIIGQPGGSTTGPNTTWNGQTTPVIGDVQKVSSSTTTNTVYVNTPDLASYVMGAWWGNAARSAGSVMQGSEDWRYAPAKRAKFSAR